MLTRNVSGQEWRSTHCNSISFGAIFLRGRYWNAVSQHNCCVFPYSPSVVATSVATRPSQPRLHLHIGRPREISFGSRYRKISLELNELNLAGTVGKSRCFFSTAISYQNNWSNVLGQKCCYSHSASSYSGPGPEFRKHPNHPCKNTRFSQKKHQITRNRMK